MENDDLDLSALSLPEIEAFGLTRAAVMLDQAKVSGDKSDLAWALDENLQLWVAIKTLAAEDECTLPREVRDNLVRLSGFVAQTTFKRGVEITEEDIDALTRINLQISEGLLQGAHQVH